MKTIAVGVCAVVLLSSITSGQAGAGWPHAWSHTYVSRVGGDVIITYVRNEGCVDHKVDPDQIRSFLVNTLARNETLSSPDTVLFANAIARLGNQGWHIIGEGAAYCHTDSRSALHLKRALY